MTRPTLPVFPWDIPVCIPKPEAKPEAKPSEYLADAPEHTPMTMLVKRRFMGDLNISDLNYMALALLQMWDESHELKQRIKLLEEAAEKGGDG